MLRLLPLLAIVAWALVMWKFSTWRLRRELAENSEPLDDPRLEAVIRRLGRAVGVEHLKANVYDQPVFNGLASPDGGIYVTRGVLDAYRLGRVSAEEVGSILAHELGHVGLGHTRRRMIDWTGQNAIRMGLSMVLGRIIPFIGVWIADLLANLAAARLSRRDEFQADAFAAALMRKANVDPEAQISMFEKLGEMTPPPGGFAWLQSHPPLPDRIAAIRERHRRWDAEGGAELPTAES